MHAQSPLVLLAVAALQGACDVEYRFTGELSGRPLEPDCVERVVHATLDRARENPDEASGPIAYRDTRVEISHTLDGTSDGVWTVRIVGHTSRDGVMALGRSTLDEVSGVCVAEDP